MKKEVVEALYQRVIEIINHYDPMGLLRLEAPTDEYKPEVEEILKELGQAEDSEAFHDRVYSVFVRFYEHTIDPKELQRILETVSPAQIEEMIDLASKHTLPGFAGQRENYRNLAEEIYALKND